MRILATFPVITAMAVGTSAITSVWVPEAHACSFGPLEKVNTKDSLETILDKIYDGCGGSVSIERVCGKQGCDISERKWGKQFILCSEASRYSTDKCALFRDGKVVETRQVSKDNFYRKLHQRF